jgi:hypothetical protein
MSVEGQEYFWRLSEAAESESPLPQGNNFFHHTAAVRPLKGTQSSSTRSAARKLSNAQSEKDDHESWSHTSTRHGRHTEPPQDAVRGTLRATPTVPPVFRRRAAPDGDALLSEMNVLADLRLGQHVR